MSRKNIDSIKVEYSNRNGTENGDENSKNSYVEFMGITRVRSGTTLNDNNDLSEKIINDIVAMDASFDTNQLPDFSTGQVKVFSTSRKTPTIVRNEKYANFHTIDWLRDLSKDRFRHRWIQKEKENGKLFEKIQAWFEACSGWFCVLLIGLGAGLVAGFVDIGSSWTQNLRSGVCKKAFWLNREQCCWDSSDIHYDNYHVVLCKDWESWTTILGVSDEGLKYFVSLFFYILFSLIFSLSAASLVKMFAPYACGSGIPEIKTILGGFVIRGYLGKWTFLIKSLGMILGTSAGLVLGKEGPFVHVASCCGNIFSYLFPKYGQNEARKREILSAAASAGVAVAFGAPIGGVLFSLEEVSYYFPLKTLWRSFFCAMFAAFVLKLVNPYGKGHDFLFNVDYDPEWSLFELIPFIFLGILGALFGYYFIKVNIFWCKKRKSTKLGRFPITEVLVITFITALIGYQNEYTRMSMTDLVRKLVGKCGAADESYLCDYVTNITSVKDNIVLLGAKSGVYESIWKLFLALLFYLAMLVLTFGIKVPCGLFVPSLTIGAIAGRLVGVGMELLSFKYPNFFIFPSECQHNETCIIPGIYALVGACAFLGGATRMTVSLVVIMVELTSGLSLIVPLMVSAFTAKLFGEMLCKGGIYDAHINLNNYPFLDNKEDFSLTTIALDVMKPQKRDPPLVILVQDGMTVGEIDSIVKNSNFNGFPVVVSIESQYLIGYICKRDILMAFEQYRINGLITDSTLVRFTRPMANRNDNSIKLHRLVDLAPICVTDQTPVEVILDLFRKMGVGVVLVTHYGKLLGLITKKDILKHIASQKENINKQQ